VYSTYLGGQADDYGQGIALDAANNAYVTGLAWSGSTTFPMVNAVQPAGAGNYDAFLTKLNSTGTGVIYSTFYGGASTDYGTAVTVDSSGSAYVTGLTQSL